jgi:hypothetical protein
LTVRTEAMVGSAGIPTAGNFAPKLIKVRVGCGRVGKHGLRLGGVQ